jgi:pimeloyl-ACP methyl ester carboxylesterase
MRKKIKVEIENTPNQVKEITAILEGENKDHCLFIGPWEIYRNTFSTGIKDALTFIGLDYYFCRDGASKNESIALTRSRLLWFYRQSLRQLSEKQQINKKIYLLAPSALGFVAIEYARFFKDQVKGIILIGMPDDLEGIDKKQTKFFENYSPDFFKKILKRFPHDKWERNKLNVKEFGQMVKDKSLSDLKRYDAELHHDEEKYYCNMNENGEFDNSLAQKMYEPWKKVNIDFRNYFFKSFMSDFNAKNIRQVDVPVFTAIGLYDGIAPPYLIPDMVQKGQLPKNFTYHIFDQSAHMPHYEQPNEFLAQLNQWKQNIANNTDDEVNQSSVFIRSNL